MHLGTVRKKTLFLEVFVGFKVNVPPHSYSMAFQNLCQLKMLKVFTVSLLGPLALKYGTVNKQVSWY